MPREQLKSLAADVDRLLAAGGASAAADEGLCKRAKALRELGAKVPALVPIAEATERVARADAGAAPRALLDLVLVVRQVQAGLATAGAEGPLEPAAPSGPWTTTAPARELAELAAAVAEPGSGLAEKLKEAIDRHVLPDLRLLGRLLRVVEGATVVAEEVATEVLPTFGAAVVPDLRRGLFDRDTPRDSDGLRLLAIGKIDPGLGVELSRRALAGESPVRRRGVPTVRGALGLLAEHAPQEAERIALDLLRQKPSAALRAAIYEALGPSQGDAALEALIAALLGDDQRWGHAYGALVRLPHPGTTERLARALEAARARHEAGRAAAGGQGRTGGAPGGVAPRDIELTRLIRLLGAVLDRRDGGRTQRWRWIVECQLLAEEGDRRAAGVLEPLLKDPNPEVRKAAVEALIELGEPGLVPRLLRALGTTLELGEGHVAEALAYLKAREAIAPMLKLAERRPATFAACQGPLWDLCGPADIPALEGLLARAKGPNMQRFWLRLIEHVRSAATDE
jgi:hypothetical protein